MVTVTTTATNNRAMGTKIIARHMSSYRRRSVMIRARQRKSTDDRFIEESTSQKHYSLRPHVTHVTYVLHMIGSSTFFLSDQHHD
jgi:hypothetical protein